VQLADALQKANKDFEMMLYPQARHGIGGQHYLKLQLEFIRRTMAWRSNRRTAGVSRPVVAEKRSR